MKKRIVIKLSGKVFGMDSTKTLKDYATFLVKISKICQPVVVAGGGKIARHYISHARLSGADESTLDELGIEVSRLNAKLLIYALKNKAYPHPPTNLQEVRHAVDSGLIVVTGGLHPGQSTNATAALIAEKIHATVFLNATDVDGIYDSDPNKNKNAKKFKRVDLKSLRRLLIHEDFVAGGYDLMDIVALKVIERSKIKTRVLKADIKKLEKAIKGIPVGTEIIIP
ncbi:MAG: UMP kinase [Nitrosopumilales archaeon]|nr:UMP kinase [Nitrosopumilales archaeon]